jgi:signal transduction histidine kinase
MDRITLNGLTFILPGEERDTALEQLAQWARSRGWSVEQEASSPSTELTTSDKYHALLHNIDQGFCIVQMIYDEQGHPRDYRFLEVNHVFEKQTGLKDAVGKTMRELQPAHEEHWFRIYGEVARTGESIHFENEAAHLAGGVWYEVFAFRFGAPEAHQVAILFNNITARKRAREALEQKVHERTGELEALNRELQRSNRNLEEFAYAASHDLQEPVRKMRYFADRLQKELQEQVSDNQRQLLERLDSAALRMTRLIDDLLAYSRVSRGVPDMEAIDLNKKVQNVLDVLELSIAEKGAQIQVDPLPTVRGNRLQLLQLFQNLLDNALKYQRPGVAPEIRITYRLAGSSEVPSAFRDRAAGAYHLITVSDNGIGFEAQDAERIFNVFTRLHGVSEYRGSGIGLSIVRKVVENHQGYIWAESVPGDGAAFHILLPVDEEGRA